MKNHYILLTIALSIFVSNISIYAKDCSYTYDAKKTQLEWTAYKFTEKTGVKGTFDQIIVQKDKKNASSINSAMKDSTFRIASTHINSGVKDRDDKIRNYFFGNNKNTKYLIGSFPEIDDGTKGKAKMSLTFNGKTKLIPVKYEIIKNKVQVTGSLDVNDFEMAPGIAKLNEVCKELHIGKDGISKLWSEVDFVINSEFKMKCKK
ncbi:MAG: YceI family protein [Leptospira sp.]|nr:YceI family protein [Leptospira sp.]